MQMEENSPSPQPSPTPQCVGREFVRQYYTLLAEAPRYVHRFYSNESIFVHGNDTEEIVGQTAIQNKIRDLSFGECRTRIRALDAHETLGKGVVVQVVGEISVNGAPMRRFVQTFVLAPQSEKKYYVHNDIFRYEDELFELKLAQENGAPADPDAEKPSDERRRRHSITPDDQSSINNGNLNHPEEIQTARYNLQQNPAQHPPSMPAMAQPPASITGSGYAAPTTLPHGVATSIQPQVGDTTIPYSGSDLGFGTVQSISAAEPVNVQSVAPTVNQYGQAPLPPRSQPQQQAGQVPSMAPVIASAAPLPSQPPLESISTTSSATGMEQPPRPPSTDKTSPVPSEDHEEPVDTGSGTGTWASRVKSKPQPHARSPNQVQNQLPQHVIPAAGPSAPAMLSPTGGINPPPGHAQQDFNKSSGALHHQNQPNRNQYRQARGPNPYGPGGPPSQDARSSPAPSGHQMDFPGGGGGNRSSPVDYLPCEQQVYVKNLPMNTTEPELKDAIETHGYQGVLETRVRRKTPAGHQHNQNQACFAFVAFDKTETAQKLIAAKTLNFRGMDVNIDVKKNMNDRPSGGGGGGNYSYNGSRAYAGPAAMSGGGGGQGGPVGRGMGPSRGGMGQQRGGGVSNRPSGGQGGSGGFGQGGVGGGGGRQQQNARTFHATGTGRGGGNMHPPQ